MKKKPTIKDAFRIILNTYGESTAADLHYRFRLAQESLTQETSHLNYLKSHPGSTVAELDTQERIVAEAQARYDEILKRIQSISQLS